MHILDIVDVDNMVPEVDQETLDDLGAKVCKEYDVDKRSMDDWLERNGKAMKLIDMKPERKTDPWPGAASSKLPLVLNAAMKASAEEFAEIMRGTELVQAEILGSHSPEKQIRGERVTKRMNHQFYHELEDWEEDHDKLILSKNIMGTVHKKIFYSDGKIQCVLRRSGVVINDNVEKIQDAPRITDEIDKFWWQVEEKTRSGEWEEIDLSKSENEDFTEDDKVNRFLEQVRRVDLDDDGYPEPYIVTVHEATKQVVRIQPNFTPESIDFDEDIDIAEYGELEDDERATVNKNLAVIRIDGNITRVKYVKYSMVPNWEGGYWDYGFGILLGPLNENCNELINMILNSGHLANKGGGFISTGVKIGGGDLRFKSNEWKKVQTSGMDLSRNIVPMPVKEPSQTLYSTLGLLMDVLRELSSVTEVMSGDQPKANMPAASIDMLIEQGKKMFNSVYKRHYRSLTKEQNAIFDLNFLYQDPQQYIDLLDLQEDPKDVPALIQGDFTREGLDVQPTANAEFSSKVQRMAKARALLEVSEDPNVNSTMVTRIYVESIVDDTELAAEIVPDQPNMTPDQVAQEVEAAQQEMMNELDTRKKEAEAKTAEAELQSAQIALMMKQQEAQSLPEKQQQELRDMRLDAANKAAKDEADIEIARENRRKAQADREKNEVDLQKERLLAPVEIEKAKLDVVKARETVKTERAKRIQQGGADYTFDPQKRILHEG